RSGLPAARCRSSSLPPIPRWRGRPRRITWHSWRASTGCARAGRRTACRWAASWNTWTAAPSRTPSAAAPNCREAGGAGPATHGTALQWGPHCRSPTVSEDTIFHQIMRREIPAEIVHEDDHLVAFRDIAPQAPVHVLFVPKKTIRSLDAARADDAELVG